MTIRYRYFRPDDFEETTKLIKNFYDETPGNSKISTLKVRKTFQEFTFHPEKGTIIICEFEKSIIGYAILFLGWSNEHSKNIIFIDELYVKENFRNQGVASGCIRFIAKEFRKNSVSLMLAVEKGNKRVERLYKELGFKVYQNKTLFYKI